MIITRTVVYTMMTLIAIVVGGASLARAQTVTVDLLETDGIWCPMAHCNRMDDSFQYLPPLLSLESVQKINDPAVSPGASIYLGCVSGEAMAVCAYDKPEYPALVAYDYQTGAVKWMSPPEDFPGVNSRRIAGVLLAKMAVNGNPFNRYVFAANSVEFAAYAVDGQRIWKRSNWAITPEAPNGVGAPVSITFNDSKELVAVTNTGWVVKLNPVDGAPIDAYRMSTNVIVGSNIYQGIFTTSNSPIVVGDILYLVVEFQADASNPLEPARSPVHIVRIELNQPGIPGMEHKIKPLIRPLTPSDPTPDRAVIGARRAGGSPSALMGQEGRVLIFADSDVFRDQQFWPAVAAVMDNQGVLSRRWRSVLNLLPGDDIRSAPALHPKSNVLLVTTEKSIYVFRNVKSLIGEEPPPAPLPINDLITCGMDNVSAKVEAGSPFGLVYNRPTNEIVAYTNFRVTPTPDSPAYGYLGAFAFPAKGPNIGRALWCTPLAVAEDESPLPGLGTFGQPALFRFDVGGRFATGLIVNTVDTGTYILRSQTATNIDPSGLLDAVNRTEAAASLISQGYSLKPGWIAYECGGGDCTIGSTISWYGFAFLPVDVGTPTNAFELNGDDAFVVYGLTPPPITYYSLTPYVKEQYNPEIAQYDFSGTSIGLGINQSNINALSGPNDSLFALVVAADHQKANVVHQALREAGLPEGSISRLLIPSRFTDTGQAFPDRLALLMRLTFRTFDEEQRLLGYMNQVPPNLRLLYFDGPGADGDVLDEDLPLWQETLRVETSEMEGGAETLLDQLVDRIVEDHLAEGYLLNGVSTQILWHLSQGNCDEFGTLCGKGYPAPDALYGHFNCPDGQTQGVCEIDFSNPSDFLVIAGVDHHQYADDTLATYFSYQLPGGSDFVVRSSIADLDAQGSAAPYLEGTTTDGSKLYAVKIARSCTGSSYCLEVPFGPFRLTMRIYLDKITGSAPNRTSLIPAKLLWFVK